MTVIAGVSLFNGVMLASDCRVTVKRPGWRTVARDEAQKIFPLTATSVIGFAGDVATASALIEDLFRQIRRGRRIDPVSLHHWLPRFFRSSYSALSKKKRAGRVDFMVGSVVPGRLNVIDRQKAADLLKVIALGSSSIQRGFLPDVLMHVLMTDPGHAMVPIPNSIAGLLCTLSSPRFQPQYIRPLEFAAIGSGQHATIEMRRTADWLLAGVPGNDFIESQALTSAVSQFVAERQIQDVGGMYPCVKIDQRGPVCLGARHRYPLYEVSLTVDPKNGRWIQENHTTGKKIELLYPWEILRRPILSDRKFDDMREAVEHANPLRAKRVSQQG
jgi:hypothetical protein